jgi:hypothetical protein
MNSSFSSILGESIPIRLFLGGFELTPTYKNIHGKFSLKYYLNLVLVDEDDRRYFKQQYVPPHSCFSTSLFLLVLVLSSSSPLLFFSSPLLRNTLSNRHQQLPNTEKSRCGEEGKQENTESKNADKRLGKLNYYRCRGNGERMVGGRR